MPIVTGCGGTQPPAPPITAVASTVGKGADEAWAPIDFRSTPSDIEVRFLVGDMDTVVGDVGARRLAERLVAAGFPAANIKIDVVRSPPVGFEATHLSVLSDSNDARRAYWLPADKVIAAARSSSAVLRVREIEAAASRP